jgi:hypothetical protein
MQVAGRAALACPLVALAKEEAPRGTSGGKRVTRLELATSSLARKMSMSID